MPTLYNGYLNRIGVVVRGAKAQHHENKIKKEEGPNWGKSLKNTRGEARRRKEREVERRGRREGEGGVAGAAALRLAVGAASLLPDAGRERWEEKRGGGKRRRGKRREGRLPPLGGSDWEEGGEKEAAGEREGRKMAGRKREREKKRREREKKRGWRLERGKKGGRE
ncbi:uncharacterized protein [Solanum lycopersicum]|uniref:uncharacterized protein n=1 Tax=Solanum lycopersicum TaxID=4081 RepID=UPI00374960F5